MGSLKVLCQIAPFYPPDISGVGDYADKLSHMLLERGVQMHTLVMNAADPADQRYAPVQRVEPDARALESALAQTDRVLLHFSGYGYARRGLCRWLVDGLAQWKRGRADARLVTIFHETSASGRIWQSSFWTAGVQGRIARDIARLSIAGFVSSQGGYDHLRALCPELPLELLPIFSTMGELASPKALDERRPRAVIFGSRERRAAVYRALSRNEERAAVALRWLGIREIVDIGPECRTPKSISGCRVEARGPLSGSEVSRLLSQEKVGLLDYPGHVFTKSSIAAAYFAHRMLVVNTSRRFGFPPDLRDGHHFVGLDRIAAGDVDADKIADAGYSWYLQHSQAVTTDRLYACLV